MIQTDCCPLVSCSLRDAFRSADAARLLGYELTGNATQHAITSHFFNILTAGENETWSPEKPGGHSFATGGSSAAEHWFSADKLADSLQPYRWGNYRDIGARTEESCTQYNTLKVSRHLFTWSADVRQADFYERGLLNGILGNMNAVNGTTVDLEYMLPFGDQGLTKPFWSASRSNFPCCWGTLAEAFAKLADSIYFRTPDNTTLFVNLFESSTVTWDGLKLQQTSVFPTEVNHTTTLTVLEAPSSGTTNRSVAIRVPWWADGTNTVAVNEETVPADKLEPSTYLLVSRVWKVGDTIEVYFPMSLRFENVDDARPLYANGYGAIMWGPLLLAGLTSERTLIFGANNTLSDVVVRDETASKAAGAPRFVATPGSSCASPYAPNVTSFAMVPFNDITGTNLSHAKFTAYFFTKAKVYTNTTDSGTAVVVLADAADMLLAGGATILPNAAEMEIEDEEKEEAELDGPFVPDYDIMTGNHFGHRHAHSHVHAPHGYHIHSLDETQTKAVGVTSGVLNLRSGSPGQHSSAAMAKPFAGSTGRISSISFTYQYVIGYGAKPNSTGASVSLAFISDLNCPEAGSTVTLYTSPRYTSPLYRKGGGGYSDPVPVHLTGLNLSVASVGALSLNFDNGDHNMQVLLPLNISVGWN